MKLSSLWTSLIKKGLQNSDCHQNKFEHLEVWIKILAIVYGLKVSEWYAFTRRQIHNNFVKFWISLKMSNTRLF